MSVIATFALLVLLLAVGRALAARLEKPGSTDATGSAGGAADVVADGLNRLGIAVFFPAAILLQAPALTAPGSPALDLLGLAAIPWILLALCVGAGALARRVFRTDAHITACVVLGCAFGNTAFLGYALVPALLGPGALRFAVVSDQLGSFVGLSTVGLVVVAAAAGRARPTVVDVVKRVLLFPPFLALCAGVTVMPAAPPADVAAALGVLAGALLPCMAIAVGLRLRFAVPRAHRAPLMVVVVGKLVLAPALALLLARAVDLDPVVADVAVVQAGMPVMVTVGALLALADVAPRLAASMVGWSTVLSMITLPLWHLLLSS